VTPQFGASLMVIITLTEASIMLIEASIKLRVYIGEGYTIMPATATVNTYLPWPPWAA
jgi:hypothetical protein